MEDPGEDVNEDGNFNAADCRGPQGPQGPQGSQGPEGPRGNRGQDGVSAFQLVNDPEPLTIGPAGATGSRSLSCPGEKKALGVGFSGNGPFQVLSAALTGNGASFSFRNDGEVPVTISLQVTCATAN